jgi:hypothetical protein
MHSAGDLPKVSPLEFVAAGRDVTQQSAAAVTEVFHALLKAAGSL